MPFLNRDGRVAHGVGSSGACIDNVQFDVGGGACWFDPQTIIYASAGSWELAFYDINTGKKSLADERGANTLYGSGTGHWVAWKDGVGIFSSTGFADAQAGLLGMSPDGAIAYKPNYHAEVGEEGSSCRVRELNGADWELTPHAVLDLQLISGRRAVWTDVHRVLHTTGLPDHVVVPGQIGRPRAIFVEGEWWLVYYSYTKGVIAHPFKSTQGYIVVPFGVDAWHDAVAMISRLIWVAWSTTLGEAAGDIEYRDIDVWAEERVELNTPPPVHDLPPTITITDYDQDGIAPMVCNAYAQSAGGPAHTIEWLLNDVVYASGDPSFIHCAYQLPEAGSYSIGVRIIGPAGSDQTATPRIVTVREPASPGGVFVQTIQLSEPSYLNWRYGGGQSLEPPTAPDDPNRDPFEHGRPVAGIDETAKLFKFADGTYGIQSPNGRSWLSVQPDGSYEERLVVDGEPGAYERFTLAGNVLTSVSAPDVQMVYP